MMKNVQEIQIFKPTQKSNCCTLTKTPNSIIAHFISNYCTLANTLKPTKNSPEMDGFFLSNNV